MFEGVKIKAFDIVEAVVNAEVEKRGGTVAADPLKMDILSTYCDVIDNIMDECFGESITVDIVEDDLVSISLSLSSFVYETRFKPRTYIELLRRAKRVRFTKCDVGLVNMEMLFPSLFD